MPDGIGLNARDALALLSESVREAGAIGLDFARRGARVTIKGDQSPVTEADLAIDAHLCRRLRAASPEVGWLSEETADTPERLGRRQVWIVDPIDGTRGFVAANGEWVISAALVEDGRPVAGVLFRPTTGELYAAARGQGATRDGQPIRATDGTATETATIAGPKPLLDRVMAFAPGARRQPTLASLALRIAFVADGRLDVAVAGADSHDWDMAAAALILEEAGGRLTAFDGQPLRYNTASAVQPALLAAGADRQAALVERLANGRA